MLTDSPPNSPARDSSGLQQQVERLTETIESLKHDNQDLQKKLHTLEGAVVPLYDNKIASYEAGHPVFQNYRKLLVENFQGDVVEQIFSSDHFVKRLFSSLRGHLLNVRGILTVLGVGTLGAFGLSTLIESTAKAVFEDRIEVEYPQLIDRLERDRNTLMLLILDLNSQDRPNMQIVRSQDLEIAKVREAYLENNPSYRELLVDFLKGEEDDSLFAGIFKDDSRYKSIQRFYALNYVLQVDPEPEFREVFYEILKDEDIERVQVGQGPAIDVHNQILAAQALRRYNNQFDNLVNDVLLNPTYQNQFDANFWQGFLNDLIFTKLDDTDIALLPALIESPVIQENRPRFASTMLVLYGLYPQLCDGEDCIQTWLTAAQTPPSQRQPEGVSKGDAATEPDNMTCLDELEADDFQALWRYRHDQRLPAEASQLSGLIQTLSCTLQAYLTNRQNFTFYQGASLFSEPDTELGQRSFTALQQDLSALHWKQIEQGQLDQDLSLGSAVYFYQTAISKASSETNNDSIYAGTEDDFYLRLLSHTDHDYSSWMLEQFYGNAQSERVTQTAFADWQEAQGIAEIDSSDPWALDDFLQNAVWDEDKKGYFYLHGDEYENLAFEYIKTGKSLEPILRLMRKVYVEEETWLTEIYPYFKDSWAEVIAYDEQQGSVYFSEVDPQAEVTGANHEQDALWKWIEAYPDQLEFKDGRWQLSEAP
ncbi:MAG: hypothetical protein AAF921_24020 [Cyanobacteria bacterium P01_D01_bin.44]